MPFDYVFDMLRLTRLRRGTGVKTEATIIHHQPIITGEYNTIRPFKKRDGVLVLRYGMVL